MAKKTYIGVDGVARKIKKIYLGIDSIARKVKKGYVGVGGVARLFFSGGELKKYPNAITSLSKTVYNNAGASNGVYAVFAGGRGQSSSSSVGAVNAYDKSLTRHSPATLSFKEADLLNAGTRVGVYALFGGRGSTTVDAYDESLSKSTASMGTAYQGMEATFNDTYALFGGSATTSYNTYVRAFNASLTRSSPTALSVGRKLLGASTNGTHALFGGGTNSSGTVVGTVDAYNTSLTRFVPDVMHYVYEADGARAGNYALFAGGGYEGMVYKNVAAYDQSLTKTIPTSMQANRYKMASTSLGEYAIFAGGSHEITCVDAYDASLTRTIWKLDVGRGHFAGASIGDYALLAGGYTASAIYSTVEAFYLD